jgi:outer membrane receptor protein involved in Fe transport
MDPMLQASAYRCPLPVVRRTLGALAAMLIVAPSQAQTDADAPAPSATSPAPAAPSRPMEEVVVFGRDTELLGAAAASSEGSVGGADLAVRPMLRVAELLESVPGLVAVQHSGSGKANQYFLRGFNLDHGTDFTTYVDGVPWNLRSHGHGQGYLDINGLMPETVERIDYRKGPYRGDVGDFAMAGASFVRTIDRLDESFVSLESGQYGWKRVAAGGSVDRGEATFTGLAEAKTYDGPWLLHESLQHTSVWGKYSTPTDFGSLAVTLSGYDGNWHPTEQIPERAIGTAVCPNEFCTLDTSPGGHTTRWIGATRMFGDLWDASAYAQYYDWKMESNPTYDFQINQFDRRWTTGGRYRRIVVEQSNLSLDVGGEFRYDDISRVGVDHEDAAVFIENLSDNAIKETSLGIYAESTWVPTDKLRVLSGLRGDIYDFDVTARNTSSFAGQKTESLVSPKLGVAYALNDRFELYGNWGRGFHSNDARGVVNTTAGVPGLSPGTGYEVGARFEVGDFKLTSTYWWLNLDSELIFVGDSNSVEPKGSSKRDGYELTMFWKPTEWLGVDAVYVGSNARYTDPSEGVRIEQSVESAGQLGVSAVKDNWEASLRVRYLGPYALTSDNLRRAGGETSINMRGAYTFGNIMVYADLLNVFDKQGKDIVYYYPAYVAGVDAPGLTSEDIDCDVVNCRMSRAMEPRTLRVGVKVSF